MLIGIRQQDLYVHESGDGSSFADHMAQSMEHWVKIMKRNLCNHCNHDKHWRENLMNFLDCFTVGSVGYDLIDFKHCVQIYSQHVQLIYEPTTTAMLESNLICGMPENWFNIFTKVNKIQFGGVIPHELLNICNQHRTEHVNLHSLGVHLNQISAFYMPDDDSVWNSDVEGPLNEQLNSNNGTISKTRMMSLLQEQYNNNH